MKRVMMLGLVAALGLLGFAYSVPSSAQPEAFTVYMSAVEYKGGENVAKESFPATPVPAGGGYILKAPNQEGRWETSTYRWEPGFIFVEEGDDVELHIWGVNGKEHPSTIEGYNINFVVKRGQLTVVRFKADKVGRFQIKCHAHLPSMNAWLIVQ